MIYEQPEWPNKAPPHMDVDRLLIQRLQAPDGRVPGQSPGFNSSSTELQLI
jgi:hypothetical protein